MSQSKIKPHKVLHFKLIKEHLSDHLRGPVAFTLRVSEKMMDCDWKFNFRSCQFLGWSLLTYNYGVLTLTVFRMCVLRLTSIDSSGPKESETFHARSASESQERETRMRTPRRNSTALWLTFQPQKKDSPNLWLRKHEPSPKLNDETF